MSKGSKQRPGEGYQDNFSRIFGEKKRERYVPPPLPSATEEEANQRVMDAFDKLIESAKKYNDPYKTPFMEIMARRQKAEGLDTPDE